MADDERLRSWRKRLAYRAQYCGIRENDLLMGGFAASHLEKLDESQLEEFEVLLGVPDGDLLNWITCRAPVPEDRNSDLMKMIQNFAKSSQAIE